MVEREQDSKMQSSSVGSMIEHGWKMEWQVVGLVWKRLSRPLNGACASC